MTLSKRLEEGFWTSIGLALPPESKVMLSQEEKLPGLFLDVLGHAAPVVPSDVPYHLIFIDLEPEANWAHRCLWVFAGAGSLYAVQNEWPPANMDDFSEILRPKDFEVSRCPECGKFVGIEGLCEECKKREGGPAGR